MSEVLRHEIRKLGLKETCKTLKEMYNPLALRLAMMDEIEDAKRWERSKAISLLFMLANNGSLNLKQIMKFSGVPRRKETRVLEHLNSMQACGLVRKVKDAEGVGYWSLVE